MQIHEKRMHDKSLLNILYAERDDAQRIIDNIMNAIEQGILTPTTKNRMEQAEEKLSEIKEKILIEQYNLQNQLKREQVVEFLQHTILQSPQLMIPTLIKKIVLYDDKIEIYYNYTDPIKPGGSSPEDSHRLFFIIDGSNLLHPAAPRTRPAFPKRESGAHFLRFRFSCSYCLYQPRLLRKLLPTAPGPAPNNAPPAKQDLF